MLTCTPIVSLEMAKSYYVQDDYYTQELTREDAWHGKIAKRLGLRGHHVTEENFNGQLQKTMERLLPKMQKGKAPRLGYDLTFSAPKSVSLAQTESPEMNEKIERAMARTLERGEHLIEDNYIFIRSGHGGNGTPKHGTMLATSFNH